MKSICVLPLNHNQHSKNCKTLKREQSLHLRPFCWGILNSIRNLIIYTDCGGCDNVQITIEIMITKRDAMRGVTRTDDAQNPRLLTANDSAKLRPGAFSQRFLACQSFAARAERAFTHTHKHTYAHRHKAGYLARRSQQLVALMISVNF